MNNNLTFPKAIFITGTDTDCGKTFAASSFICAFKNLGLRVAGMKPVASGSERADGQLVNSDVQALKRHANVRLPERIINPYIFAPPISPHFAAAEQGVKIDIGKISDAFEQCCNAADIVIVEGAGGWRVPLAADLDVSSMVKTLSLPVILVSGVKLGCINHTLLSAEGIKADGVDLIGWAANVIDPTYKNVAATIEHIAAHIEPPLTAQFDWNHGQRVDSLDSRRLDYAAPNPAIAAKGIDLELLRISTTQKV